MKKKLEIIQSWILTFIVTILVKYKSTGFIWMFILVYGPNTLSQRNEFWRELINIRTYFDVVWLIGGDFNVVRNRQERKDRTYNHLVSVKFNSFY
jgi:hypothetical protein